MAALYSRKCLTNKQVGEHTPCSTKMAVKLESMFLFSREIRLKTALTVANFAFFDNSADPTRPPDNEQKKVGGQVVFAIVGILTEMSAIQRDANQN